MGGDGVLLGRFLLGLATWGVIFSVSFERWVGPPLARVRRGFEDAVRGGDLEGQRIPRILAVLLCALVLSGEILLQTGWTAYCAERTLRFAANPAAGSRVPFYALGFLACQIPLARIARREEHLSFTASLRSIIPMGMFASFCLYPHQLDFYRWLLELTGS